MTDRVHVVVGIIIHQDRLLLTQRLPDKEFPYMWESPGGKVEPTDSSLNAALERELHEELGPFKGIIAPVPVLSINYDPPIVRTACALTYFVVRPRHRFVPAQLTAAIGFGWFTNSEMGRLKLVPGNQIVHERLKGWMMP